jgi:hypothetical protein
MLKKKVCSQFFLWFQKKLNSNVKKKGVLTIFSLVSKKGAIPIVANQAFFGNIGHVLNP